MRTWGDEFIQKFKPHPTVVKAIFNIARCRTPKLGGRRIECLECGHTLEVYNSCGNRNCPICQSIKKELWIDKTAAMLLPVPHSHVVFTVPHELNPLFFHNMKALYGILFASANKAVQELCADPKWLGAQPGMVATLHTWGSSTIFHPHLHVILSAGGWDERQQKWIEPQKLKYGFFIPQKVLAACFKKHFLFAFAELWREDKLLLPKELMHLNNHVAFKQFYNQIAFKKNWIVKVMPPLDNPKRVIDYLGRYVYRVAITDSRIKEVNVKERRIVFEYKDYEAQSDPTKPPPIKPMSLEAMEFIRRFAQHVLPQGFQKIRYYGIYGTAYRKKILPLILQTLKPPISQVIVRSVSQIVTAITGHNPNACPCCGAEKLVVHLIVPIKTPVYAQTTPQINKHNNHIARPPPHSQPLFGEAVGLSA